MDQNVCLLIEVRLVKRDARTLSASSVRIIMDLSPNVVGRTQYSIKHNEQLPGSVEQANTVAAKAGTLCLNFTGDSHLVFLELGLSLIKPPPPAGTMVNVMKELHSN